MSGSLTSGQTRRAGGVRVAELVASLSYAADLGLGQPMEHSIRQTVIALRLAELVGATQVEREATYYLGLMISAYCHADAAEQARWFGDDIAFKADAFELLGKNTAQVVAFLVRRAGSHGGGLDRIRRMATMPTSGVRQVMGFLTTHAQLISEFADQVGLDKMTVATFRQAYEQWDGRGVPLGLRGPMIALPARLVQVAGAAEVYARRHGVEAMCKAIGRAGGADLDPTLVNLLREHVDSLFVGLHEAAEWSAILDSEPCLARRVDGPGLDAVLEAMADLADMKSPQFAGHSRGVANLAAAGARAQRLPEASVTIVRRAGLLHDLGRLGVSNSIWDKPGELTASEMEHVRLHPYLTERMLAGVDALAASRWVAGRHHERLDGSGYPRGLTGASLDPMDRLLAAADTYHTMCEVRPHRAAFTPSQAAAALTSEVLAGRLDGDAVAAVLSAAGHTGPTRRSWPDGLTAREAEVLALLARGNSNKQIAERLTVAPKTVANHVEHVYTKIGVTSRAAATLFAMQRGLVGAFEARSD